MVYINVWLLLLVFGCFTCQAMQKENHRRVHKLETLVYVSFWHM